MVNTLSFKAKKNENCLRTRPKTEFHIQNQSLNYIVWTGRFVLK